MGNPVKTGITTLISLATEEQAIAGLRERYPTSEFRVGPYLDDVGQTMPVVYMQGAEVLLCDIPPVNFNDFDSLKWIQLASAGYSQMFGLPINEHGIRVTNAQGVFDVPVAEWNVMMMLNCHRHL